MTDLPPGMAQGMLHNKNSQLNACYEAIGNLKRQCEDLMEENEGLQYNLDQASAHFVAQGAQLEAAMAALDEAHGGADKNPLRKQAYSDPDELRIPKGPRKGQVTTKLDHIFFAKFADLHKRHYAKKWGKSWIRFISKYMFD